MGDFIIEPERRTRIVAQVDVLVAGAGPAGFAAAISAARLGATVILLEQSGAVGGIATNGLMSHWTGKTEGGIYEEILRRSENLTQEILAPTNDHLAPRQIIDHEGLKTLMLEMLEEAHVKLRLNTFAVAPIMEGTHVKGCIVESKAGREAILAEITIDATGDGDLAARAGAEYFVGRESDGSMQPASLMLKVGGVDTQRVRYIYGFEDDWIVPAGSIQALSKAQLPYPAGHVLIYPSTQPGTVVLNMTNAIDVDGTDPESVTRGELTCRRQIRPILEFLREVAPGFERCFLVAASASLGIRETRHFRGVKTITEHDIAEAKLFDDWVVAKAHFNFDVHNITGSGLDVTGTQKGFVQRRGYTIPYGCLVPECIDGLLFAGRNISGTHLAHSNYRVMPICANIGQAAGIAAALCVRNRIDPRSLEPTKIQTVLRESGIDPGDGTLTR